MSRRRTGEGPNEVRRRIAATAATAAIAVSGPALAAKPASAARGKQPPRAGTTRTLDGGSARGAGADDIDAARRQELAAHRRLIASALSAELGAGQSGAIERELGQIDAEMGAAYARGERPAMDGGLPAELGRRIGVGTDDVAEAFEAMARHALERRRGQSGGQRSGR